MRFEGQVHLDVLQEHDLDIGAILDTFIRKVPWVVSKDLAAKHELEGPLVLDAPRPHCCTLEDVGGGIRVTSGAGSYMLRQVLHMESEELASGR